MKANLSKITVAFCALPFLVVIFLASCGGGGGNSGGGGTQPGPLTITTSSLPKWYTGLAYDQPLTSSGGRAPITWSYSGFFPAGLTLSSSGRITGTVTNAVFGDVTFEARDSSSPPQTAQKALRMTFEWGLDIDPNDPPAAYIGAPYDAVLIASMAVDSNTWKVTSGSLPPGLALTNPTTTQVEISGTPTQSGTYSFTLQVKDSATPQQVASHTYTLVVQSSLAITPASIPDGIVGDFYSVQLSCPNGKPPYTWSSPRLPSGLTLDPGTGLLSGTPTGSGNFWFDVNVKDSSSSQLTGTHRFGLLIAYKLEISPVLPDAYWKKPYVTSINYNGGMAPITWSIISGALPPGITLSDRTLSGTPTELGDYSFTVQAKDSSTTAPQIAQAVVNLKVKTVPLSIDAFFPLRLPIGAPFDGYFAATGGIPPYSWTVLSGSLPPGLNVEAATGRISGTPTTIGNFNFTIQVTDSLPQNASRTWNMTIAQGSGRNDSITKATPIADGDTWASISPYADPPDTSGPVPDTDYYKIIGNAGTVVKVEIFAQLLSQALDPVLEIVDSNGSRLSSCRLPGDTTENYNSTCLNDDIEQGTNIDSELELKVSGATGTQTTFYAHVLDFRGDARPDMRYDIKVTGSVPPLKILTTSVSTFAVGQTINFNFSAYGGTTPLTWTVESGSLPPGLSLTTDGNLNGSPTTAGTYAFTLRVTDSASPAQTAAQAYTAAIEVPPAITTTSLPDAYTGVSYSQQLTATGGTPPYYWSNGTDCISNPCALGLNVNGNGILSGIPKSPGTFTMTLALQDRAGFWARKDLSIAIHAGPLVRPDVTLSDGKVGSPYQQYVNDTVGGTPPYIFALVSGTVPPGLTFSTQYGAGALIGTPTQAGTFKFTISVADSAQPAQSTNAVVTVTIIE